MHYPGLDTWMRTRRAKSPDKAALITGDGEIVTYRRLADAADRVSALLCARAIGRGDSVAYLGENSPEFLATLFGCAQLGAVFVPVNTRLAPPEILHVLADSRARVLVHDRGFADRLAPLVSAVGIAHVIETGDLSGVETGDLSVVEVGSEQREFAAGPDDPAAIIYTSGTTGRAKGAVLTHGNLTWVAINSLVDYDIVSTDVALMISPLFHVASLGMGALPVLLKGGTIVLEKGFDPGRALRLIAEHGVTMLSGVPTTYQLMADHPDWPSTDLSTLTKLTCGGSAVPTRILNAYEDRGLHFSQGYGMTETSPGATSLSPAMTREKQGSVGLPHFFTEVRVAAEDGPGVGPGSVGEIQITGPNVFAGYLHQPEATASAFTPDGWFRSGDLGFVDADGYLFISDRLKDMIISGGENIYPAEVENLISDLDGVTGVAVIGVPDGQWGEVPWAIVTVREGASVDTASVRGHLDGRLARYKVPKHVVVVGELPRTATGKVKKAELRSRFGRS
ncbi:fatty-acyl-CoA synthase [Microbacterium sp. cf046]|uniref:acyl-CoA synthetase n=1 Tax=Microbacterium sp. cf046 TaxID=1761803 RepID=UPI0008E643F8|nr:long-chain fatty acid--CoA ligase [Microbacterium sp. cf046]SFS14235.1 fatty-acyl-CoA synthase [Microbacterium sp. cf046]